MGPRVLTNAAVAAATALFAWSSAARADPANSLTELRDQLNACLQTATAGDSLDITIVFSLKRDGNVFGKPRISYSKMPDTAESQRRVADAVAKALQSCLPFSITNRFGGAIAGRPLAIRIRTGTPRDTKT